MTKKCLQIVYAERSIFPDEGISLYLPIKHTFSRLSVLSNRKSSARAACSVAKTATPMPISRAAEADTLAVNRKLIGYILRNTAGTTSRRAKTETPLKAV